MRSLRIPLFFCLSTLALTLSIAASPARAVSLRFEPSSSSIAVDELVSVDVVISGLGTSGAPSLGGFDLDVRYASSVIARSDVSFGSFLGDPALFEVQTAVTLTFERTNLLALSFLTSDELDALQSSDSFVLATLTFRGLALGTSPLEFANVLLSDANGDALLLDTAISGSVTVVPEPSTALMFGLGLFALGIGAPGRR